MTAKLVSNANTDCRTRHIGKNIIVSKNHPPGNEHVDGRHETNEDNEQFQTK